jgi:hypothetical protein
VGSPDIAFAESSYNDLSTAEGWAWSKIRKGEWADFNLRCDPQAQQLDPKVDDARWQNDCRKITATFLQDLLTITPFRESTPFTSVRIIGARIVRSLSDQNGLDLENAKLIRPIEIAGSRIEADINQMQVQTASPIAFNACLINREFRAEGLRSKSEISITDDEIISSKVNLNDARIDGNVYVLGTHLDGEFDATALHVSGSLDISSSANNKSWFKKVVKLDSAKIGGNVQMFGVVFDDALVASYLQVGGYYLSMARSTPTGQSTTFQQKVSVNGAKISGLVDMSDVSFGSELNADYLEVGSYLSMRKAHFTEAVNMAFAKVHGPLELNKTRFDSKLDAFQLQVSGYVSMQDAKFAGNVRFPFAKFDNNLDLRNATVANLDLSGASIAGGLQLASQNAHANWKTGDGKDGDLNYAMRTSIILWMKSKHGRSGVISFSMAQVLTIWVDTKGRQKGTCSNGARSGGMNTGRNLIPNIALPRMPNLRLPLQPWGIATALTRSVTEHARANSRWLRKKLGATVNAK